MTTRLFAIAMAGLLAATLASPAAPPTVLRSHTIDHKIDTQTFTGTIESIDTAKFTLVVHGHEVIEHKTSHVVRHESVNTPVHPDQPKKNTAPPKSSNQTFKADISCKITEPDKPVALLSELKDGDTITVSYTVVADPTGKSAKVASEITVKKHSK